VSRENTAAANRRDMHTDRIRQARRPRVRLALAWAWLFAESRHLPDDDVEKLAARVKRAAARINGRWSR
jgi:hypothetical protein